MGKVNMEKLQALSSNSGSNSSAQDGNEYIAVSLPMLEARPIIITAKATVLRFVIGMIILIRSMSKWS